MNSMTLTRSERNIKMNDIPSPDQIFPHACRTSCFIKNVIKAPNISVGEYTYYDDPIDPKRVWTARCPAQLSRIRRSPDHRQVLPDRLSAKFIMRSADHRLCSVSTYPFDVMGGTWTENTTPHVHRDQRYSYLYDLRRQPGKKEQRPLWRWTERAAAIPLVGSGAAAADRDPSAALRPRLRSSQTHIARRARLNKEHSPQHEIISMSCFFVLTRQNDPL